MVRDVLSPYAGFPPGFRDLQRSRYEPNITEGLVDYWPLRYGTDSLIANGSRVPQGFSTEAVDSDGTQLDRTALEFKAATTNTARIEPLGLLAENAHTELLADPHDYSNWTPTNLGTVQQNGPARIISGQDPWEFPEDSTAAVEHKLEDPVTVANSKTYYVALLVARGNRQKVRISIPTLATPLTFDFDTVAGTFANVSGADGTWERKANASFWEIVGRFTTGGADAGAHNVTLNILDNAGNATFDGLGQVSLYLGPCNVGENLSNTSPVLTQVTRSADDFAIPNAGFKTGSDYTIAVVATPNSNTGTAAADRYIYVNYADATNFLYLFWFRINGTIIFQHSVGGVNEIAIVGSTQNWPAWGPVVIVATAKVGTAVLYANGASEGTDNPANQSSAVAANSLLGRSPTLLTKNHDGNISHLMVFDRFMEADEVALLTAQMQGWISGASL